MKVRKAIKSIAALGVGAAMLGMTMGGAMAADLSGYPSMFIKDGQFDGILVIGKNADAVDTIGMTNIALGLQAAAVTKTTVCSSSSSATSSVSEGVKIDKSTAHMYLNTNISDVIPTLDESDLPEVLGDEVYNDNVGETDNKNVDVSQEISFFQGGGQFVYAQDDDLAETAAPYLRFTEDVRAYEYILEFDSDIDIDNSTASDAADDLETTTIDMQGQTYTITEAKFGSTVVNIEKLTLMAGETTTWMTQGQTVTKGDHTVEMVDVTEDADACGFDIDGTTVWIDNGDTETISGLTIGVIDAKAVHAELQDVDICKVNFGASELVLENGEEVSKDGDEIDGSAVILSAQGDPTAGTWTGINITWAPDDDDYYLAVGEELVDPVFGNFKFVFGGVVENYETVDVSASTTDGEIKFMNSDGVEVVIPFALNDGEDGIVFGDGDDADERMYFGSTTHLNCTGTTDVEDCKGATWLLNFNKEAHVIEIADLDMDNDKIKLEDLTYGTTSGAVVYTDGATADLYFSGIGTVTVEVNETKKAVSLYVDAINTIESEYGTVLTGFEAPAAAAAGGLNFTWTDNEGTDATIKVSVDANSDGEIEIDAPTVGVNALYSDLAFSDSDDDNRLYVTGFGSKVEYDSDGKDSLKIYLPEKMVKAEVYVAPTGASVSSTEGAGEGCQVYDTVNKIPSSVNKFDTDVVSPTAQNLVTVGGPCANAVTSALLGNPPVCYEGFEAGTAMIKLVETGDKVALIVAGGTGEDTKRASMILQNYDNYALSGKEMVATTVSESALSVQAVTQ